MATPTRFPSGVGTAKKTAMMGAFPLPNPVDVALAFWDFDQFVAGDWTVTNTTSHATIGLVVTSSTVPAGGVLELVGGASSANNDIAAIQTTPLNMYFSTTSKVWFECHVQAANASNQAFIAGISSDLSALAPTDGIYFSKAAASANIDFVVRKSSTSTTASAVTTLTAATNTKLGFYFDGGSNIFVYKDDVLIARQTTLTNLPAAVVLGPGFGIKMSATSPTTAAYYTDFILTAQSRSY